MRRVLATAVALAVGTWAAAQDARFTHLVGYELQQTLRNPQVALSPQSGIHATFYAQAPNALEEVVCELEASFGLIALANDGGNVLVSICDASAERVRALARDGRRGLDAVMAALRGAVRLDDAAVERLDWTYRRVDSADGEEHYFPVLLIGHGVLGPQTMVLLPNGRRRAVIVQADVQRLCRQGGVTASPICTELRATLATLARRVAVRLSSSK